MYRRFRTNKCFATLFQAWTKGTPVIGCLVCTGAACVRPAHFLRCNTQNVAAEM